jgi:hypothetical protein
MPEMESLELAAIIEEYFSALGGQRVAAIPH